MLINYILQGGNDMKNDNYNLKEKSMDPKELESVSGGYHIDLGGGWSWCFRNYSCGNACYNVCPTRAIYWVNCRRGSGWNIDYNICTSCGKCASVCPNGYIKG
jgi:NAD-dependent dihydropyrimidine dehydrogenase PreA subunit